LKSNLSQKYTFKFSVKIFFIINKKIITETSNLNETRNITTPDYKINQ